jgi:teichuronic acid exporter
VSAVSPPEVPATPQPKDDLRARTVTSVLWVVADRWINRVASLVVFAIIGRLLGASEIGLVALAATFVALFQVFADQGFSDALIQRKDLDDSHPDSAFWVSVGTSTALCLAIVAVAGPLSSLLQTPDLAPVLRVLSITMVLSSLSSTPAALLERDFGFKQLTQRRVVANLSGGVVGVIAAFAGAGVWAIVAQSLSSSLIGVVILWSVVSWRPKLRINWKSVGDLRSVGLNVIGIQLFAFLNNQADKFVIGAFISPAALGFYYIGMRMITIIGDIQTSVIQQVSLTALSKVQDDLPRFRRAFVALTGTSAALGVFTYAYFAAMAPVLIPLVFGDDWGPSVRIAQILCVMGALNSVITFDRSALVALGRARLALQITATQSIVGVVVVVAAAPFGIVAVAIGVSVRQYAVWPFRLRTLREAIGLPIWTYLRQWVLPAVAGGVMFAALTGIREALPTARTVPEQLGVAAIGAFVGVVLYVGIGRRLFPDILEQFTRAIKQRRARRRAA